MELRIDAPHIDLKDELNLEFHAQGSDVCIELTDEGARRACRVEPVSNISRNCEERN